MAGDCGRSRDLRRGVGYAPPPGEAAGRGGGMGGGVPEGVEGRVRAVLEGLPGRDVDLFVVRWRRWWNDLVEGLRGPYGGRHDLDGLLERVAVLLAERYRGRGEEVE